ncbi:MAG: hypothetical protein L3J43_00810 [Sulfurovum sp.]|nr:hypothetical protein [Sulfurovum sp.]
MDEENKIDLDIEKVVEESKALTTQEKKLKKHQEAKKLVQEAKSIVQESENELQDCKLLLADDMHEYVEAVKALKIGGLDESKAFLSRLSDINLDSTDIDLDEKVFEAKDDITPLNLKDVNSGKFTGFLFSLLGGAATFGALIYWATEKLGMTLDITKIPSNETIQTIFGWFGTQVGQQDDAMVGGILVAAAVLAVMALLYMIRVALKSSSNLHFAKAQMKETQKYITQKSNCKVEMDRVDAHIKDAVNVLKDYEILLHEQKGKLQRIFYFEEGKSKLSEFSNASLTTMEETQGLIEQVQKFIATPMSHEGRLSEEKENALEHAKLYADKLLKMWN